MEGEEILSKNLNDYLHYKKYSADFTMAYDIPKDLNVPSEKLKPAVKLDCEVPREQRRRGVQKRVGQKLASTGAALDPTVGHVLSFHDTAAPPYVSGMGPCLRKMMLVPQRLRDRLGGRIIVTVIQAIAASSSTTAAVWVAWLT